MGGILNKKSNYMIVSAVFYLIFVVSLMFLIFSSGNSVGKAVSGITNSNHFECNSDSDCFANGCCCTSINDHSDCKFQGDFCNCVEFTNCICLNRMCTWKLNEDYKNCMKHLK